MVLLLDFVVLRADDIKEIGGLDDNLSEIRASEEVALGVIEDITQTIIVAPLNNQVAQLRQ